MSIFSKRALRYKESLFGGFIIVYNDKEFADVV